SSTSSGTSAHSRINTSTSSINSSSNTSSSSSRLAVVVVVVVVVLVVVGAGRRSNGTPEEGGSVAGEAMLGTGTVVRKQVGVGGEVCLRIPPPRAATITPGTRRIFPVRLVTSRLATRTCHRHRHHRRRRCRTMDCYSRRRHHHRHRHLKFYSSSRCPALHPSLPLRLLPEHLHLPRLTTTSTHGTFSATRRVGFRVIGIAGLGLLGQSNSEAIKGRVVGPPGSEIWVSAYGATNHITNDSSNVYDSVPVPPGKEQVLIGNGKGMRVRGVGRLNLKMHSKTDFNANLTGVYVTEGIGFNLFSLHDAQARQTMTLDKDGVHLFDNRLTFPRD
ncbi:unnamed protein product, partial [Laminaria digitata]